LNLLDLYFEFAWIYILNLPDLYFDFFRISFPREATKKLPALISSRQEAKSFYFL